MSIRLATLALLLITTTACTSLPDQYREHPGLSGQSVSYKEGFFDGARTGRHITGHYLTVHHIDIKRYQNDNGYRAGWDTGMHMAIEEAQ